MSGRGHRWTRSLFVCLMVLLSCFGSPTARRLRLRPLSSSEIANLENLVPSGRSVSSGVAALTGFALGLGKALTGVFIYDVITANITEAEEPVMENSANRRSVREICINTGISESNRNSDVTCIIYYAQN